MAHRSQLTACAQIGTAIMATIAQVLADEAPHDFRTPETLSMSRQAPGHAEEHVTLGQRTPRSSARARATGESASVAVTVSVEKGAKSNASSRASSRSISPNR